MKIFLTKINNGYDGLIRQVNIKSFSTAEVVISVMDSENNYEWINVKFTMKSIIEFKIIQKLNTSNIVMSGGIKILYINSNIYIDFSPYSDEIEGLEDVRESDFYFGCKSIDWEIESYSE